MRALYLAMVSALALIPLEPLASADGLSELVPLEDHDFHGNGEFGAAKVKLGNLLFFDKILSGNKNISCASCHHPDHATSDGLALGIGEGGTGLGDERRVADDSPILGRVPRNSQALFFVGAKQYRSLFHDGRVEPDPTNAWPSGFWTPAREQLPKGLENVLAAQAMFPVLSHIEMAGHKGENPVATAIANDQLSGENGAWDLLAQRLRAIPAYVQLFADVFDDVNTADDITFVHAANAIAAFETVAFRTDNSPFDAYLRSGDSNVLGDQAADGMALFYGKAGCGQCHSGSLQTDNDFHAIAMPQIGPGKQHGQDTSYWRGSGFPDRLEDQGRYRVSFDPEDKYAFRTPSLRNVELTGPWGHAGSYATLEDVIRHHLDPISSLQNYQPDNADLVPVYNLIEKAGQGSKLLFPAVNPARLDDYLARDTWVHRSEVLRASIAEANDLAPNPLNEQEVTQIVAFLRSLTDPISRDLSHLIPAAVPSGLSISD